MGTASLENRSIPEVNRNTDRILVAAPVAIADDLVREFTESGQEVVKVSDAADWQAAQDLGPFSLACVSPDVVDSSSIHTISPIRILLANGQSTISDSIRSQYTLQLTPGQVGAQVEMLVRLATDWRCMRRRCTELERRMRVGEKALIGCSASSRRLNTALSRAAESDVTILIEGATGTGKSTAARIVHDNSRRSDKSLVLLESDHLPEQALRQGLEDASRGTLLIENVEELPPQTQAMLVRFLKERAGNGANSARIVTTTSARIPELVARGVFREDLYYRLSVFPVVLPALKERREDITVLAHHFLARAGEAAGRSVNGFTPSAMILLESHPLEGNVSQLQSVVERAYSLTEDDEPVDRIHLLGPSTGLSASSMESTHLIEEPGEDAELGEGDIRPLQEEEKRLLSRALKATRGNVRRAAKLLGIGRATLYRKIQIYDLRLN